MKAQKLAVHADVQNALDHANTGQRLAGRSEAGRKWSIIVTELEKVDALLLAWGADGGLEYEDTESLPPPVAPDDD